MDKNINVIISEIAESREWSDFPPFSYVLGKYEKIAENSASFGWEQNSTLEKTISF